MKTFFFLFVFSWAFSGTSFAAEAPTTVADLQTYKNEGLHYSVAVPASWIRRDQKIPGHSSVIEFISPRHEGSLLVMPSEEGGDCKEVLKKLEAERKLTNVLPAAGRAISADDLKNAHAQAGLKAQYEFPAKDKIQAVQQNAWCLQKGSQKRILLGTFRKTNSPDLFGAIFKSFAFLDKK